MTPPDTKEWKLANLVDTRANLCDAIEQTQSLPNHAKKFLQESLQAFPDSKRIFRVDAFSHEVHDKMVINVTLSALG